MKALADSGDLKVDVISFPDVLGFRDLIEQETSRSLQEPLSGGRRQAHYRRFAAGFHRLARQALLQADIELPRRLCGLCGGDERPGVRGDRPGLLERAIRSSPTRMAKRRAICCWRRSRWPRTNTGRRIAVQCLVHGQFLREDQVDRIKALDVFPSLFPMHTFYWGDWHRDRTVGPGACRQYLANRLGPEAGG